MRPDTLSTLTLSISNDTVAIRDKTDEKLVHLFDSNTGKALESKPLAHKVSFISLINMIAGTFLLKNIDNCRSCKFLGQRGPFLEMFKRYVLFSLKISQGS